MKDLLFLFKAIIIIIIIKNPQQSLADSTRRETKNKRTGISISISPQTLRLDLTFSAFCYSNRTSEISAAGLRRRVPNLHTHNPFFLPPTHSDFFTSSPPSHVLYLIYLLSAAGKEKKSCRAVAKGRGPPPPRLCFGRPPDHEEVYLSYTE